jgi:hypothetical protein
MCALLTTETPKMSDVLEKIRSAYQRERQNPVPPRAASDLPLSYEAITDEWLTNVLCPRYPQARVVAHQLGPIDEGSTSRRRIFIDYNDVGQKTSLPRSLFAKASHNLSARLSGGIAGAVFGEYTFYTKIRPLIEIEAPVSVFANYDPETLNSIILMRDLGDATEFCTLATDMTEARLRGQMSLLAGIHGFFYAGSATVDAIADLLTWPEWFGRLTAVGLDKHCDNGFAEAKEVIPPRLFACRAAIWPATLASVAQHTSLPHTLVHSDPHIRNWYISSRGEMGLNDWQCACRGHWSRDIAYALTAAMPVERRRQLGSSLLDHYLEKLRAAGGPRIGLADAWRFIRPQLLSALAWWTYTMPIKGIANKQPLDATLEMIKRISHAIDDLDALDSIGEPLPA